MGDRGNLVSDDFVRRGSNAIRKSERDPGVGRRTRRVHWGDETSGSTGGGDTSCGCCNCFNCVDPAHAIVGGCSSCGNGAADRYTVDLGVWDARPEVGGVITLKYSLTGPSSSSSSSSSSSESLDDSIKGPCVWWSDPFTVSSKGQWIGSTAYSIGDSVFSHGHFYTCTTAGTSASSGGPTGTGTGITDGTCVWDFVS